VRWHAPNTLDTALACFRRAIRAHRRLARLAPSFFDSTVVERERREQEVRRRWLDQCQLALHKVYGTALDPFARVPEHPLLPGPNTRVAIERELAAWRLWLCLGSDALQRSKLYHPHSVVNLITLARSLETASALGHLATGVDSTRAQSAAAFYTTVLADLHRIYGKPLANENTDVNVQAHR
jgi:hypothetical protein